MPGTAANAQPNIHAVPHRAATAICLLLAAIGGLVGCASGSKSRARPRAEANAIVARDVAPALRGLIGAQASLQGRDTLLVTGYGVVVGLDGTGSTGDIPVPVRAVLEREMALRGVGADRFGMGWTTPSRMLDDPNTAVVLVQGVLAPGAREGDSFDVRVEALPGGSTTSLEGGRLWTADLRRGVASPGGPDTPVLAQAFGPVFINPFEDPAAGEDSTIAKRAGRVLGGGEVLEPRSLALTLDSPSHTRARAIAAAINQRFPPRPARPRAHRDRPQ